jgi:hypothetical protein
MSLETLAETMASAEAWMSSDDAVQLSPKAPMISPRYLKGAAHRLGWESVRVRVKWWL